MFDWAEHLKSKNRHFPTEEHWQFFSSIVALIEERRYTYASGALLYRARKHRAGQISPYLPHELGAPPPELCRGGRCNPEGISCLYLADSSPTAIAETRPWKDALVSVGKFELTRDLKLADLRSIGHRAELFTSDDPSTSLDTISKVLYILFMKESFSRPSHEESKVEYVPTQFVASLLESRGFDGIIYSSLLNASGVNVAVFDTTSAELKSVEIHEVWSVHYGTRIKTEQANTGNLSTPGA
jgi:hypothetical protein